MIPQLYEPNFFNQLIHSNYDHEINVILALPQIYFKEITTNNLFLLGDEIKKNFKNYKFIYSGSPYISNS